MASVARPGAWERSRSSTGFSRPAYALLLAIVLLKLRGSVEATSGPDQQNEIASARILRRGEELNEESFAAEYANVKSLRRTGLRLIGVTLAAVPVLFLLDELENVLIPVVYHETPSGDWFGPLFFPSAGPRCSSGRSES